MRSFILSVAGLAALAAAQPVVEKRDYVTTETVYTEVVKTIEVTSTTYISGPTHSPETPDKPAPVHHHKGPQHQHHHKKPTPVASSAADEPPPSPTQQPPPPPPPAHKPAHKAGPPPAPEPPAPKPAPPAPKPVAPKPVAPKPAPVAPKPAPAPAPAPAAPASSNSGDMTHYAPGLGSCGMTNSAGDDVVALAVDMMDNPANPNENPLCGKKITIDYNGQQHTAEIVDTCWGCATEDIDLSPTLFKKVAPTGDGRVYNVKWWISE